MLTRRSISILAALAIATTLFATADDPLAGTWKLDPSKSKHSGDVPEAKEATIIVENQGDSYQVTATGTYSNGSPLSIKYTVPIAGGPGTVQEVAGGLFDAFTAKRISANERVNTYTKEGKAAGTRRFVISKDGKTMTNSFKSTDAKGNPVTSVQVFIKQ